MASQILRCPSCGGYGLKEACSCGGSRIAPRPPKYSPEDKYADYRRKYKELHPEEARRAELVPQKAGSEKRPAANVPSFVQRRKAAE